MRSKKSLVIIPIATLVVLIFAAISRLIWLPDVLFSTVHVLASASSEDGHQFQIVQYWNHSDFYTTELEDLRPDQETVIAQIDWDDLKHWSGAIRVVESEKKLFIIFPSDRRKFEYRWDLGAIVAPYDRRGFPIVLHSRARSGLTKSGEAVPSTRSFAREGKKGSSDNH